MAGVKNVGVVVACLVALIQISSSAATSYTVGGSTGWAVPSSTNFYSSWASTNTYNVGDNLVFNFVSGHTVTEVSKSDYDACSTSTPISATTTSPATISLTTAGAHYFICTTPTHCSSGQKFTVTAGASSSTTAASPSSSTTTTAEGPSSTTTPTTTTASSPPPPPSDSSSSSSSAVAGVVLPVMLLTAAFF